MYPEWETAPHTCSGRIDCTYTAFRSTGWTCLTFESVALLGYVYRILSLRAAVRDCNDEPLMKHISSILPFMSPSTSAVQFSVEMLQRPHSVPCLYPGRFHAYVVTFTSFSRACFPGGFSLSQYCSSETILLEPRQYSTLGILWKMRAKTET